MVTATAAPDAASMRLRRRASLRLPDIYVTADDEGDWLTCPTCDQKP
ncbi:hypothetical protein AB0I89_26690 [Micromonospora sp. NPDC049801]